MSFYHADCDFPELLDEVPHALSAIFLCDNGKGAILRKVIYGKFRFHCCIVHKKDEFFEEFRAICLDIPFRNI